MLERQGKYGKSPKINAGKIQCKKRMRGSEGSDASRVTFTSFHAQLVFK